MKKPSLKRVLNQLHTQECLNNFEAFSSVVHQLPLTPKNLLDLMQGVFDAQLEKDVVRSYSGFLKQYAQSNPHWYDEWSESIYNLNTVLLSKTQDTDWFELLAPTWRTLDPLDKQNFVISTWNNFLFCSNTVMAEHFLQYDDLNRILRKNFSSVINVFLNDIELYQFMRQHDLPINLNTLWDNAVVIGGNKPVVLEWICSLPETTPEFIANKFVYYWTPSPSQSTIDGQFKMFEHHLKGYCLPQDKQVRFCDLAAERINQALANNLFEMHSNILFLMDPLQMLSTLTPEKHPFLFKDAKGEAFINHCLNELNSTQLQEFVHHVKTNNIPFYREFPLVQQSLLATSLPTKSFHKKKHKI